MGGNANDPASAEIASDINFNRGCALQKQLDGRALPRISSCKPSNSCMPKPSLNSLPVCLRASR
eukprot:5037758-Lingulodinium_polyedra.AAC.1